MRRPIDKQASESNETSNARDAETAPRASSSALRTAPPTPAEMVRAARALLSQLEFLNRNLDAAIASGKTADEAWKTVEYWQRAPSRPGISPVPGTVQAIRAYAVRTTLEDNRKLLGMTTSYLALAFVRSQITAPEALDFIGGIRGDGHLEQPELVTTLERIVGNPRRSEPSEWQSVYNILAWDADIWPRPDTKSGLRGKMRKLYESHAEQEDAPDVVSWVRSH